MKKYFLCGSFCITVLAIVSFTAENSPLVGKWEYSGTDHGTPYTFLAIFKANGNFDGFINKKAFVSGTYHMNHDTLFMSDPTCNSAYEGRYKVEFFGMPDSLKAHVIQDTCAGRREGTDGILFKKVNPAVK